jgi:hypothetical protein
VTPTAWAAAERQQVSCEISRRLGSTSFQNGINSIYYEETRLSAQGREPVVRPDHSRNGRIEGLDAQDEEWEDRGFRCSRRNSRAWVCCTNMPRFAGCGDWLYETMACHSHSHEARDTVSRGAKTQSWGGRAHTHYSVLQTIQKSDASL